VRRLLAATLLAATPFLRAQTIQQLATPTKAAQNSAPAWVRKGTFVYRLATPDTPNVLPALAEDFRITSNLLDHTIQQVPIVMGLIGHDHRGGWNWDGLWPDWDRVTFRAVDWDHLNTFMQTVARDDNTRVSFHVNLTDVNVGLKDYPESRAFFQKLVATKSIYTRDRNPVTRQRDGTPYIPQTIPEDLPGPKGPIDIFAIVNYKNFWDSGLARQMIDTF
jgi:hypothetical protein